MGWCEGNWNVNSKCKCRNSKQIGGSMGSSTGRSGGKYRFIKDLVFDLVRESSGRISYDEVTAEIRKHFPLSEAKISLMITELEHKGIVNRIKKGRGNVIILNK